MYQKVFSAKDEKSVKTAVIWWVAGTIVVETAIASLAIMAFSYFNGLDPSSVYFLAAEQSERIILHTATFGTVIGIPVAAGPWLVCLGVVINSSARDRLLLLAPFILAWDRYHSVDQQVD